MKMQLQSLNAQRRELPAVATVGTFDGVHLGHRFLIRQVKAEAERRGMSSMVITFDRHPAMLFGYDKPLLTTTEEKLQLIKATGIDKLAVLAFDEGLARLTAGEFMQQLQSQLQVRAIVVGFNNHFGSDRRQVSPESAPEGLDIIAAEAFQADGLDVSSTAIRNDLLQGDVEQASQRLGRPYSLSGRVVHGQHIGTQLGFPTANLDVDKGRLIPKAGVYAVRAGEHGGILNIGTRPTFNGHETTLEVHLVDFEGDLYGRLLTIEFIRRLRDERQFPSAEELARQLQRDKVESIQILKQL